MSDCGCGGKNNDADFSDSSSGFSEETSVEDQSVGFDSESIGFSVSIAPPKKAVKSKRDKRGNDDKHNKCRKRNLFLTLSNECTPIHNGDPCLKFEVGKKKWYTGQGLVHEVNSQFVGACIPCNVIILVNDVHETCAKFDCNKKPKVVGRAITFLHRRKPHCGCEAIVAEAWILLVFCKGQVLLKTDCDNFLEIQRRCTTLGSCRGKDIDFTAAATLTLVGTTDKFCAFEGCANLVGVIQPNFDVQRDAMLYKQFSSDVEAQRSLYIKWFLELNLTQVR